MNNKAIFLTGCNGQLGKAIINTFKKNNWLVFGLDLEPPKNLDLDGFIQGSVLKRGDFKKLFK